MIITVAGGEQEEVAGPPEHWRDGPHAEGVVNRIDKGEEQDSNAGEEKEGAEGEASDAKGQQRRHGRDGDSHEGQPVGTGGIMWCSDGTSWRGGHSRLENIHDYGGGHYGLYFWILHLYSQPRVLQRAQFILYVKYEYCVKGRMAYSLRARGSLTPSPCLGV